MEASTNRTASAVSVGRPATHYGDVAPDRGCQYAARCTACPWRECIAELPAKEHTTFVHALRLVRSYLAEPDSVIAG